MPRNFNNNDMIEEVLGVFIIVRIDWNQKKKQSSTKILQEVGQTIKTDVMDGIIQ